MEYSINMSAKRKIDGIDVSHRGEIITFRGTQSVIGGDANQPLYSFLNTFFEGVRDSQLDELWDCLKEAKHILEPGYFNEEESEELELLREKGLDYHFLIQRLTPLFKRIYRAIPPRDIGYAAQINGFTVAPKDLMHMAMQGDYPEETTINPAKYSELVKLAFVIQLTFPIMNQLLEKVITVTGKEYQYAVAGEIIVACHEVTEMEGWKVLDTYIRASCLRQESRRNTMEVVSNDRYVDNIIYRGAFQKLALTFIPSIDRDKNLSKQLNSLVEGEIRKEQAVRFTTYNDKKPGADDQSIPESYRINQNVNGSEELAQAEYFSFGMFDEKEKERHHGFFKYVCLGLGIKNQHLAERIYVSMPTVWNFHLLKTHIRLLQLVYKEDIGAYLVPALDGTQLKAAIALAQVKLFEMGYERLAQLCGITRNPDNPISYMSDEFKLNTKERESLCEICYLYDGQSQSSTDNLMVRATQEILDELANSGWDSNIEPGLLGSEEFVSHMSPGDMYEVGLTVDVKHELLDLIMKMNNVQKDVE